MSVTVPLAHWLWTHSLPVVVCDALAYAFVFAGPTVAAGLCVGRTKSFLFDVAVHRKLSQLYRVLFTVPR